MYEQELKSTYDKIKNLQLNSEIKFEIEDWEVIELVHRYRMYWKPTKIKTLLLAESHVFTKSDLISHKFNIETVLNDYPQQYVRFIYCLAYGEDHLLNIKQGGGTPQFWKLFKECNSHFSSPKKDYNIYKTRNTNNYDRLKEKILLLEQMKSNGIWLMDCSIAGIYNLGKKPAKKVYGKILDTSFENYCMPILKNELEKNTSIIVIGKGVYDQINDNIPIELKSITHWIHQPNARIKSEKRKDFLNYKHECLIEAI